MFSSSIAQQWCDKKWMFLYLVERYLLNIILCIKNIGDIRGGENWA
jgi:hypothetical protein